jgi:hypothetical protein
MKSPIVEGEESIGKSVIRLLVAFFIIGIIGIIGYLLTTKTDINPSYFFIPILILGAWSFPFIFVAELFAPIKKNSYKIQKWPYKVVIPEKIYIFQLKKEKPLLFYTIILTYIIIASILTYFLLRVII